ncbi:MAG: response regulator [Planctomycetota bacterium]|jgi:two-component system chemotaxis response regulator CheY
MKVLIVEDDFSVRNLMNHWFQDWAECHVAVNGQEALQAIFEALDQKAPYDLVLMDIKMPGIDGVDALKRIRLEEEQRKTPKKEAAKIIMTTALTDSSHVVESFAGRCNEYLTKPFSKAELFEVIRRIGLTHP